MFALHLKVKASRLGKGISRSWKRINDLKKKKKVLFKENQDWEKGWHYAGEFNLKNLFLPHQFLAILYMLAALTYISQASSILEGPLCERPELSL